MSENEWIWAVRIFPEYSRLKFIEIESRPFRKPIQDCSYDESIAVDDSVLFIL